MGASADLLSTVVPSLALIVGALLLVRRWAQRGSRASNAGIRVISRAGLSRNAIVAVVEVGDQRYFVGASEQGVSLLSEMPSPGSGHDQFQPAAMEVPHATIDRPRMGLIDRMRDMTVRTHLERPMHARDG